MRSQALIKAQNKYKTSEKGELNIQRCRKNELEKLRNKRLFRKIIKQMIYYMNLGCINLKRVAR